MSFEIAFWSLFIGIIGSLIANHIYPVIGDFIAELSTSYRDKRAEKLKERNKKIMELADNETLLTLASINSHVFDIFFFLTFIVYLLLPPVSLMNMVASLFFGFFSMVAAYRGAKKRKLFTDAVEVYKRKTSPEKDI